MRAVHATAGLVARQLDSASSRPHRPTSVQASFKSSPADKKMSFSRGASRARVGVVSRASLSPETAENVVMQISGVIKFGAPMYNKGDARGCARLYRQTALSIARDASVTSQEIRDILRDAVAKGDEIARDAAETDPMGGEEDQATQERVAWALRRGLDRVVDLIMDPPTDEPTVFRPSSTEYSNQPDEKMGDDSEGSKSAAPRTPTITAETAALFDFAKTPDLAGRWRSLNDGVMGGVSDGVVRMRMSDSGESHATFEGTVRLENNGGFSSVRTSFGSGIDLSQFSGFYLDVRPGDETSAGKEYLLVVKDDEAMTTQVNFKAKFCTGKRLGAWERVEVPFAAFDRPERMGRAVMRGALRTEAVCEVGFMVLKGEGNVGAFALDVREVGCLK